MAYKIEHNKSKKRFETTVDDYLSVLEYKLFDEGIIFTHTGVPEELEGMGIGSALAKTALDYAIDNHMKIIPICPFVKYYIGKHPEYQIYISK